VAKRDEAYVANGDRTVFFKYTVKGHSPWRFTVSADDIDRFNEAAGEFRTCVIALVCGGDGICATSWGATKQLLDGAPGWLAAKRKFGGCYSVSGPRGDLERKVALNQWPGILFDEEQNQ